MERLDLSITWTQYPVPLQDIVDNLFPYSYTRFMNEGATHTRGANIILIKMWIEKRFGTEGITIVTGKLSEGAKKMLSLPVSNMWYPTEYLKELYAAIDTEFSKKLPDALLDCGRFNAESAASGFLRYLLRLLTVPKLLKRLKALWKHYNKGGSVEASEIIEKDERKEILVTIRDSNIGAPGCVVLKGYFEVVLSKTGVRNISVEKESCIHKGDDACSWLVSWKE